MNLLFNIINRTVGVLGTLVTAYYSTNAETDVLLKLGLFFVMGLCAISLALDLYGTIRNRPIVFDKKKDGYELKIKDHMLKEIKSSKHVAIFSKDLTWVDIDSNAYSILEGKAKKEELTIFIQKETDIIKKLKSAGAIINVYSKPTNNGFCPKSRFTILDYGNTGQRVMIGAARDGSHLINHYQSNNFDIVQLASDFIELLKNTSRPAK